MSYCCPHSRSTGKLFSLFARSYCRRFKKKGFESSQKQLLSGLEQAGFKNATLLEIGCGVGHLHQTLLEQGAQSAVGVDLAPKMLQQASAWAGERGLAGRTNYIEGDFMNLADGIKPADVTLLDKVICCYPDAHGLVHRSLDKTKQVYAITIPRKRWHVQAAMAVGAFFMWLARSDFRGYVHDPVQIEAWVTQQGFRKIFQAETFIWLSQVYVMTG